MEQVAAGITQLRIQRFVNLYFVEAGEPGEWVLIDTGLPGSEDTIKKAAAKLFGAESKPKAIFLTHGHMDHAGSALALAEYWQVPIHAHELEMPFLTGRAVYPPADPTVGGSLAFVSRFFPPQSFQFDGHVQALEPDLHEPPFMPGWQCIHVPGHAPGQVAFFRHQDATLLGGDAFATTDHDSVPAILLGLPRISRAGTPITFDWQASWQSVAKLAHLRPNAIGCGHGPVMCGPHVAEQLLEFSTHFPIPKHGRYVNHPARTDENGVEYLPPAPPDTLPAQLALVGGVAALVAAGVWWWSSHHRRVRTTQHEWAL